MLRVSNFVDSFIRFFLPQIFALLLCACLNWILFLISTFLSTFFSTFFYLYSQLPGNILDDTVLIETLAQSKNTSEEINEKIREASLITIEISVQSELYRPVAKRLKKAFYFYLIKLSFALNCLIVLLYVRPEIIIYTRWYSFLLFLLLLTS